MIHRNEAPSSRQRSGLYCPQWKSRTDGVMETAYRHSKYKTTLQILKTSWGIFDKLLNAELL
jgi:hypothetical protein